MEEILHNYIKQFKSLKRGFNKGLGKAPHKPILLISIIQLVRKKVITSNRIYITPELILSFKSNWKNMVQSKHIPNFALPFFHLRSEPFWYLSTKPGLQLSVSSSKSIKSFKSLNDTISFAEIDKQLFLLMNDPETSLFLEEFILNEYFSIKQSQLIDFEGFNFENEIENEILNEDKTSYQTRIRELQEQLNEDEFQEEIFVRGGLFKKAIPKIYNYQCCISEMKIETTVNAQMVDACHIVPFSISKDDTIPNGISLSPNLHRAYDRGLITINKDYIVRISPTVIENNSVYSISQFNGKQISLPEKVKWYPSPEGLLWHTKEVFQI
ncbi:putative restriction endonuclease [Lutibacter oceani]|uniref:Putative restriction endonuclease n=1 Tax=Lutibacter oceani TaxID=1853311 RepID=A0A3D9RID6_9FLAO|nr:HNH endonuclease [Lutibacter oceani]REE78839.1 putative restriction endonuclease [Lutibacter oceani]